MNQKLPPLFEKLCPLITAAILWSTSGLSARADTVFVTSTCSNAASTTVCGSAVNLDVNPKTGNPVYSDVNGFFIAAQVSSQVTDKPKTPGGRYFSNSFSNTTPDQGITLAPALGVTGGVYKVYHIFSSMGANVSGDIILGVANTEDCTLSFTQTDKFQRKYGTSVQKWQTLGLLTNAPGKANPRITFFYKEGTVSSLTTNRLIVDTFKFVTCDPCTDTDAVNVTGPLDENSNTVVVARVTNATVLKIYQNSGSGFQLLGSKTSGIVDGDNAVTVTGLVKGAQVVATQTVNDQEGCVPTTGPVVGGGPNPRLRLALSVREAVNAPGPVGANGSAYTTNANRIHFLGAESISSAFGPGEGRILYPSNGWQTVTFLRGSDYESPVDPCIIWNSSTSGQIGTQNDLQGDWGTIEAIAFQIDDLTDTGPYLFYVDNISNGGITNTPVTVEDFENAPAGTADFTFRSPTYSGSTSDYLLPAPNEAVVNNQVADTGTKSLRVRFQWSSLSPVNWLRLTTSAAPGGHPNPMVNLNDPITFRILFQPQGITTPPAPAPPTLTATTVAGKTVLSWSGGHRLQTALNISGPYTNIPGTILAPYTNTYLAPFTNPFTESRRFFRLVD